MMTINSTQTFSVVVPAAGVGRRMQSAVPKQYLPVLLDSRSSDSNLSGSSSNKSQTILELTISRLLAHPQISQVIVAIGEQDGYFSDLTIANHPQVIRVAGGKERADSVLSGLNYLTAMKPQPTWVLVHDAVRPCITLQDIDALIEQCLKHNQGGILGSPVRDTMKRVDANNNIETTVERSNLWHAMTPQMFPLQALANALQDGLTNNKNITDEASAMELAGVSPLMVQGRTDNIKITQPQDLELAQWLLSKQIADL